MFDYATLNPNNGLSKIGQNIQIKEGINTSMKPAYFTVPHSYVFGLPDPDPYPIIFNGSGYDLL